MAFNVTSNFAGKSAGMYIAASLKEAKSLGFLTQMNNVRYKSNVQTVAGADLVRDANCDFLDHGTLDMTEKVLEPKGLQINIDLCKQKLVSSWESLEMSGPGAMPPASFEDYVISYMGQSIAQATENSIWSGVAANQGEFTGFLGTAVGYLLPGVDATVIQSAAGGAYTTGTIIAELQTLVNDMAGSVPNILTADDTYIYMNPKTYTYYISAVSALNAFPFNNMNADYEPVFEGYKIAVCPGMLDNQMVAARKSNLFFGTDLTSDFGELGTGPRISLMDMSALDGSDNIRCVARYSAGVQTGIGADIVRQS